MTGGPLHLVRNLPPRMDGRPMDVEAFFRLAAGWARKGGTYAGFWTRRRPRRTSEMAGGSVYFAVRGETVFRMPFVRMERVSRFQPQAEPDWRNHWAIVCEPVTVLVEARRMRRLQGWRYLTDEQAPKDIDPGGRRSP